MDDRYPSGTDGANRFERVTRANPCAICGKHDYCARLTRYHWCMRLESNRPHEKGGWLHDRTDVDRDIPIPKRRPRKTAEELDAIWRSVAVVAERNAAGRLGGLSEKLGVPVRSLEVMGVGIDDENGYWTFPEKNENGMIVGITKRLFTPINGKDKMFSKGSSRGVTYCDDWSDFDGPVFIVEGASDVAACITLGLCAIGRPNNIGGVDIIARMLRDAGDRKIVVVGENDRKSQESLAKSPSEHRAGCSCCAMCWPGKYGMIRVNEALSKKLKRRIDFLMPPKKYKDMRDFVKSLDASEYEEYGEAIRRAGFPKKHKACR